MNFKSTLALGALAVTTLAGSGCHPTPTSAWYDVYGNYCGSGTPTPGCNFYADGAKINAHDDPYASQNVMYFGTYGYYDSYGASKLYTGWAWASPDGILYANDGTALNEAGEQDSRDIITELSKREHQVVVIVGKQFAAKYALSDDTGIQIAKTLNDWATLSKKLKRARTDQDVADFSKRLYGVSFEKASAALDSAKKGDFAAVEAVNADVATYWGTNPETSKAILKSWYKNELAAYGVK